MFYELMHFLILIGYGIAFGVLAYEYRRLEKKHRKLCDMLRDRMFSHSLTERLS